MTVSQVRVALADLLQTPPAHPSLIASKIERQLRRNEESRRSHWRRQGSEPPPRLKPAKTKGIQIAQ